MQPSHPPSDRRSDSGTNVPLAEALVPPAVGRARLLIGLLQGVLLYWLYRAGRDHLWPASVPMLFDALLLALVVAPLLLVSSLGHLRAPRVLQWMAAGAAISAALGAYDAWRHAIAEQPGATGIAGHFADAPPAPLALCVLAGFFIAHALVLAGAAEGRRIATYPAYFEAAWKLAVQLSFSAFFVGATWLVLTLGGALFMLVRLALLQELLREPWFAIPVVALAFSAALHLTDVRPAIVRGIRALLLVLMAWILPVATALIGAFLASLPLTGLAPLWATNMAGAVLLATCALLVVMINAAWQNGTALASAPALVRISARAAALLLAPVTAIAVYALGLRVAEYGWTNERIIAAASLLVAACYALGYAWAALRKGWLDGIASVNVGTAFVELALLLALFSPLADPARLSVRHQLARLAAGKVAPARFDYRYLRFDGVRFGRAALAQLAAGASGAGGADAALIRQGALQALSASDRPPRGVGEAVAPADLALNLAAWPSGTRLPRSFLDSKYAAAPAVPACLWRAGSTCDAYLVALSGDGRPQVMVIGSVRGGGAVVMGQDSQGTWRPVLRLPHQFAGCAAVRQHLMAGRFRAVAPVGKVLEIAGRPVPALPVEAGDANACK